MGNKFKRFLALFLAVMMVVSYVPTNVFATENGTEETPVVENPAEETPNEGEADAQSDESETAVEGDDTTTEGNETEAVVVYFDNSVAKWDAVDAYLATESGSNFQLDCVKEENGLFSVVFDEDFLQHGPSLEEIVKIGFCEHAGGGYTSIAAFENGKTYGTADFTISDESITVYWDNSGMLLEDLSVMLSCEHGGENGPNKTHYGEWAFAKSVNDNIYEFEIPGCTVGHTIWFSGMSDGEYVQNKFTVAANAIYPSAPTSAAPEVVIPQEKPEGVEADEDTYKSVVEELSTNEAAKNFELSEGVSALTIELTNVKQNTETGIVTVSYDVTPVRENDSVEVTFRLPVHGQYEKVNVYHETTLMGAYDVKEEAGGLYVEITSSDFSVYAVEPVVEEETSYVAKIGTTGYETLAAAIEAANAGDTIMLCADLNTADVTIKNNITLDLGGKTITDAYIKIEAKVTVQNGSIKNTNESYPLVVNSGELTIENVAIEASKSDRAIWLRNSGAVLNFNSGSLLATKGENNSYSKIYGIWVSQGTTANINGGSITVDAGPDATAVAIFGNYTNTVNVTGGKISTSGKNYSYAIWADGDVTVTGGEIITNEKQYGYSSGITYGKNYAINSKGDVEISGGTITTNGPSGYLVNAGGSNQEVTISNVKFTNVLTEADKTAGGHSGPNLIYGSSVTAEITGGEFNGVNAQLIKGTGSTLTVSGGTFDVAINDEYLADGMKMEQNADGSYGVKSTPKGNDFTGYTREDAIWGEVWGNATESFVIKVLDANGNVMGTTTLNNVGGIIDGDVNVTWSLKLDAASNTDEYWTMNWTTAPSVDNMPAKVELWVDGVKVSGGNVVLNGPDEINKIYAASVDANGNITKYYTKLADAMSSGTVLVLRDVIESFATVKDVTLIGNNVTVTNTDTENWINMTNVTIGSGVTLAIDNAYYTGAGVNVIEGTLSVVTLYNANNSKTTVQNGGKIVTTGMIVNRYHNDAEAGIYVYGDGNAETVEVSCADTIGTYSGTFYAKDAVVEGNMLWIDYKKNSTEESDSYAQSTPKFENSVLNIASELRFYKDATLTLTNSSVTAGKVQIRQDATPVVNIDSASSIKATTVENLSGANLNAVLGEDGTVTFKRLLLGAGTEEDPILINDLADLILFRDTVNTYTQDGSNQFKGKYVKLTADINLAGINWTPIGTNSVGDHSAFLGVFDGADHTISNLYINADGDHLGFFARVGSYAEDCTPTVKNLKLHNVDVSSNTTNGHGGSYVGGLIANAGGNSVVSNVEITGEVYIVGYGYVGGIVGHGYPDIDNCHVNADYGWVHAHYWCAGGIIGYAGEGGTPITNSSVSGLDIWTAYGAGGAVAGLLQDGNKVENVSASNVEITSNSDYCMGYIAGNGECSTMTNVTVTNVTATAKGNVITATDAVASVDGAIYFDLQSALNAAAAGTGEVTVEILRDIDLTNVDWSPVTVSAPGYPTVTVNGNKKTITGLNDMLFAGTWAGGSGLIINDLTISGANIAHDVDDAAGNIGVGAFIGYPQASATITLKNCHLVNSTVNGGHWTGGLIGMAGGYNGNDGPVFMNLTITGCSVTGSTITGKGSVGGVIGHGSCAAWTNVVIENTTVSGNTITSTGSSTIKAGSVMGTIGAAGQSTTAAGETKTGGASVSAAVSGNTVTSGGTTITTIYGRQGTSTGVLTLTGGTYDSYPIEENVTYAAPTEGFKIAQNGNGTYGVVVDPAYGKVAMIGEAYYATLADAVAAAQAGDEIVLLADVTEDVTVPAGVIFNGNGKQVGAITAAGEITFKGHTKATNFGVQYTNTTINIGAGACLEITGTGRLVIGHGCTFNITGTITDAKTADKATIQPSLIMPGASFTGAGVTFNVTNAYIKAPSSYCSSSKSASGTFDFNITNSIIETAGKLAFEAQSTAATVNFELKDSVLNTGSHLVFGVSRGEVVIDNSNVNVGTSRQIENRSTMTIKNGSVVNGAVATSSNAKNPGTLIVDNATYAVTGEFSGSDLGTGTLIIKKGATVSVGSIVDKANVVIDATGMAAGDEINFTGNLSKYTGTVEVINNDGLEAKIVDGKIVLAKKPVAKIGETSYTSLQEAFKAATSGCTIEILSDVTISEKWDCRDYATNGSHSQFNEAVTINGNDHTIKFTGAINDSNWNTVFRFEENATVNNLKIDISEATGAQRVITAKKSLTVDGLTIIGSAKYGIIFGEGASAAELAAAEIVIKNSTLTGTRRAISDNEGGKDVKSAVITGNTLNANVYVSASESITFNNNIAKGEVDLRSYAAENVLSVEAKGNTLTAGVKNYIYAKTADAQAEFATERPAFKVSTKAELDAALDAAEDGDTIILTADIDYGTQLRIEKSVTLDLGGKTLTTAGNGGIILKNNPSIKNGNIVHKGAVAAIKAWNVISFENLVIEATNTTAKNPIGGIVVQNEPTVCVGSIKNVTIKGAGLTNGIETYNCGDATENVIGSMENVTIDAKGTGMLISAPCGTATNCSIKGGTNAIELWIKGTYSASLDLVNSKVEGGVSVHDEYASNVTNNGTLSLTVDAATTGVTEETVTLTINHAKEENVKGDVLENIIDKAQAKLNGTYCETLAEALTAAQANDTVTLLADVSTDASVVVTQNLTIDGNGKKLTVTGAYGIDVKAGVNLVINDLTLESNNYAINLRGASDNATVEINNSYIKGYGALNIWGTNVTVDVNDSTLHGHNSVTGNSNAFAAIVLNAKPSINEIANGTKVNVNGGKIITSRGDGCEVMGVGRIDSETGEINISNTTVIENNGGVDQLIQYAVARRGDVICTSLQGAIDNAAAGETVTLLRNVTIDTPVTITKNVVIDGNGKTLTYTGTDRAIDVPNTANGADVAISDLTLNFTGRYSQRGINYNTNGKLTLDKVTVNGTNVTYAVNLPGSSDGAQVTITNSDITGLIALNVWGANAKVNVTDTALTSVDNATHENYAAVKLNNNGTDAAEGTEITITGGSITALDENKQPSSATTNSTSTGKIIISDTTTVTGKNDEVVAVVLYDGASEFYGCFSLQDAIERAANDSKATVKLLKDITTSEPITINGGVVIDLNGKTITSGVSTIVVDGGDLTVKDSGTTGKIITTDTTVDCEAIAVKNGGKLTLDGGAVESGCNGIYAYTSGGHIFMNGGSITLSGENKDGLAITVASDAGSATITGGKIDANGVNWPMYTWGGPISITGGTFDFNPSAAYVAYGYGTEKTTVDGETWYQVVKIDPVAYIGTTGYYTIAAAIENANPGDTVTVNTYTHSGDLKIDKDITLEAADNAVVTINGQLQIKADGVTVKGLKVNCGGTALSINAKDVLVEDCEITGAWSGMYQSYTTGKVTFKDSKITGKSGYAIHFDGSAGGEIVIDNCELSGWTSLASTIKNVTVTGTEFVENEVYNYVRFYQENVVIDGCTFNEKMNVDLGVDEATVTVTNSTVENGTVEGLFKGADIVKSTITVDGVKLVREAKIGDVYYKTIAEAIAAAQPGDTVKVFAGTYAVPSMKAGITIEGETNADGTPAVLLEGTLSGTLENLTLKNLHIKGADAQRWAYAKGNLVFENVTFEATSIYALHFDGIDEGTTLLYKDCTIIGWAAMGGSPASCVFEGCTIKDNGRYGVIRTYFDATIKDCTFDVANANTTDVYQDGIHAVGGAEVTVNNCTNKNGDMKDLVNVSGTSVVVVDGEKIQNVAKIGDNYYLTLAEAVAAAKAGDEIVLLADATVEGTLALPAGITLTSDGHTINGSIRMLGDLTLNGPLTITGGLWVGKSGETLTATLSGDKLTASYFMFQYGTYTIDADIDAVYGYLSYEGTFEVNSTIHTTGANGEVLYINGNVTLNDGAVLDSDNSVFVCNDNAVLTLKPGSKVDSNVKITTSGAKLIIDATGLTAGAYGAITGTVTNSGNGTIGVVGNDKLEAKIVDGKIVLSEKPVAKIGDKYYLTLAEAMTAAQPGDVVTILAGDYTENLNVNKAITVVGEGTVNFTGKLNITADGAAVKNLNFNNGSGNGGYINAKDVLVEGCTVVGGNGFRSCYTKGTVTFKDSTITGSTYGIHFDGSAGGEIVIDNCVITGWTSFAKTIKKVTMTDTTFEEGNYNYVRFYQEEVVIDGCTFNEKMAVDLAVNDATLTVTNSIVENGNVEDLFEDADIVNSTITVDGEKLVRAAKIGDVYYETIADAIAAAQPGETVTILAGDYTENLNVNKAITVVGETDDQGNNLVKINGGIDITADGATVKNLTASDPATTGYNSTLYINAKDVLVEGCVITDHNAMRYCETDGTVTFKDSTITGSTYGIHFNGTAGGEIVIDNCVITGWTSFAKTIKKVTMTDTTFEEGNYNYVRFYQEEVVIDGCTFNEKMAVDVDDSVAAKVTVTDSTVENGTVEGLFEGADIVKSTITVDGVKLVREAKIGDVYYKTIAEAIAAVGAGDVVIDLVADATLDYNAREAYGTAETTSLTINGNGNTLTLNQKDSDWSSIGLANADAKLVLNDMTIEKTGYGDTSGEWNTHSIIFSCNVEMKDVTVNNAIAVENGATLNNVTINEANGYYGLWISGNGQTVTVNGGEINATNGGRGIKIADEYVDSPKQVTLNVTDTKFNTANKAAVLVTSTAGAKVTANGVDISGVAEDTVNFVWVDEDRAANFGNVEVTGATKAQEAVETFNIVVKDGDKIVSYFKTLEEAAAQIATDGSDTTIKILQDVEVGSDIEFVYGTGKVTFEADTPVTIKQTALGTDFDFTKQLANNIVIGKNVTFEVYDNSSGIYLYYGPSLELNGTITGGQNWGALYLFQGEHTVTETGKIGTGRTQIGYTTLTVKGEVDTNYLLVEGSTFTADGATVDAGVIYDNNNGGQRWGASTFNITNSSVVNAGTVTLSYADSVLTIDMSSTLNATTITGAGKIVIDAKDYTSGAACPITGNASTFAGTLEVINNDNVVASIDEDGNIVLTEIVYVAQVGETKYETLQEAVNAADANGVIDLLTDVAQDEVVIVKKPLTIKANGKTISIDDNIACMKYNKTQLTAEEVDGKIVVKPVTIADVDAGEAVAYVDVDNDGHVDEKLTTLQAALDAAAATGGTVKLKGDLTVNSTVIIPTDVTLDIEANTLTVKTLIGLNGSKLTGTVGTGKLVVLKDNVLLSESAVTNASGFATLPIWVTDHYEFSLFVIAKEDKTNGVDLTVADDSITMKFRHRLSGSYMSMMENDGGLAHGVKVIVKLTWENPGNGMAEQTFVYNDEMFKTISSGKYVYTFKLTNYEELGIDLNNDVYISAAVVADCGVVASSEEVKVTLTN